MDRQAVLPENERYWLAHSEGFRVESHGGRVGIVDRVVEDDEHEAVALVVRAGLLGTRLVVVPAGEVASVAARRKRLRLRASPEIGTRSFLREVVDRPRRSERHRPRAPGEGR